MNKGKKILKRVGVILGSILLGIALIAMLVYLFSTSSVETISYYDSEYYHKTLARLDSAKSNRFRETTNSIQAGFARTNITPRLINAGESDSEGNFAQVPLAGFGARKGKPATGIHDSIFVKAAALRIGEEMLVLVSGDLLIMPPNIIDSVTTKLSEKGIRREQVYYSATHTHSSLGAWGTGFVGELVAGKQNPVMERWLVRKICEVVISAVDDLRPARIATGTFTVGAYTNNRLIGESGTKNNDFSFISLEQVGHRKAIIGSYAAHATTLGADNWEISADYPGYWARKMEAGSVDYALFFAGSVGSQSPAGEGKGFDKAKYIGEALADSLTARLSKLALKDTTTFSSLSVRMDLPDYNIRITSNTNLTTWVSRKLLPFSDNTYLQCVRIGNMIWISTPSDFSGEYALQLKRSLAEYGFEANVTSFNGSYVGYIVPGRYFFLDEYEPKAMGWFGPNMGEYTMELIRQMSRVITHEENI